MTNMSMIEASNDDWYPNEVAEFMILKDNMDSHTYEIEANFKDQLLGRQLNTGNGHVTQLTQITGFEVGQEEYTPALSSDRVLNARLLFHVDGECEKDGVRSHVCKLPVYFDFEYESHNTGYTISAMNINC
ncbi:MAG: hypothetical protein JKY88_05955 [Pseudomonadales bacterium]|nr:hypothetical protein [Pseudomonadales bacterium]